MTKIYIVNYSGHDFSKAESEGTLIPLSEGSMNRFNVTHMARRFSEIMKDSTTNDYILPCSLTVMNIIACSIFAVKHGTLNLLLYKEEEGQNGRYLKRRIILSNTSTQSMGHS